MSILYARHLVMLSLISALLVGTSSFCQADDTISDTLLFGSESNGVVLTQKQMQESRGASGILINSLTSTQTLGATSSGNSISVGGDMINGDITMGNDFGGFGSFVMNTGNNSTINSAVSLNVQILPSP